MNADDFPRFSEVWSRTLRSTTTRRFDAAELADRVSIAWAVLAGLTLQQVEEGLARHLSDPDRKGFPPDPSDVLRAVNGKTSDRADMAWRKIRYAIRTFGTTRNLVFDDPLIHVALRKLGGFSRLCLSSSNELEFKRNEFRGLYAELVMSPKQPPALPILGHCDEHEAPALIGNAEQATALIPQLEQASKQARRLAIESYKPRRESLPSVRNAKKGADFIANWRKRHGRNASC